MQRRKFSREFDLEAVKLVLERGACATQAACDLDVHAEVLRKWIREAEGDPGSAFPGHGNLRPEQHEIERLRREPARIKAERDIPRKRPPTSRRTRYDDRLHREALGYLAGIVDLRGAQGLAQWLPRLADARAKRACSQRRGTRRARSCKLHLQLSHLWPAPCLARSSGRRPVMLPASRRTADAGAWAKGSPPTSRPAQG